MKLILCGVLLFLISCSNNLVEKYSARPNSNFEFSILQGVTDSSSTVIRIVYPSFLRPVFKITDSSGKTVKISKVRDFKRKSYEFVITHLFFKDLKTKERYKLSISTQHKNWKDERFFKTLSGKGSRTKILMASCMNDMFNDVGNIIWTKALAHRPELIFFTGDNLYADIYSGIYIGAKLPTSVEHLWRRHIDHAMTMKVYRTKNLIPSFAIWDDHDYGVNDGNKSYKNKEKSLEIFRIFFPTYNNEYVSSGHGVGFSFKFRKQNYLFLDGRTFRDSAEKKDGFHLGIAQRSWIKDQAQNSKDLNWLITGDQFFGGYHPFESFEGNHPLEFSKFKDELRAIAKKFVFISGDRHLIEVIKIPKKEIGQETFEYTISGIHTKMYPGSLSRDPNPKRVDGFDGEPNYAIIEADLLNSGKTQIRFKAYSDKKLMIDRTDTF